MNRWEIEVQRSLLKSEEDALAELEKQYARALRDINQKVKLFQADIDMLDEALNQEGLDAATKFRLQSQKQSKIYQQQYQKALQSQIGGILDKMHGDNYTTIDSYLKGCYETGFVGTMYDIAKQGIPIISPIDQAAAVRAILTDSKIAEGFYNRLGVDVAHLKTVIAQEISRGIASGLPYRDIARNINNASGSGLYNAKRIVRTEGHRVQQTSARDAQYAAKAKGADVLKQWDAVLDSRTRDSHARLDGEIRELDEKFSNGLRFPGDPHGPAAEVINCRCTSDTRARWALDEDELQTLKDRAAYFGIDKTDSFDDFKEKYLIAAGKSIENSGVDAIIGFKKANTIDEAKEFAQDVLGIGQTTAYSLGMNIDVANRLNEAIFKISNTFGSLTEYGYLDNVLIYTNKNGAYAAYVDSLRSVFLPPDVKRKTALKIMAKDAAKEYELGAWSTPDAMHTIYHELGHAVQHMLLDSDAQKRNAINVLYKQTFSDILGDGFTWTTNAAVAEQMAGKAKDAAFSYYGLRNASEMVAESIAQYFLSPNPSDIAKKVVSILNGGV